VQPSVYLKYHIDDIARVADQRRLGAAALQYSGLRNDDTVIQIELQVARHSMSVNGDCLDQRSLYPLRLARKASILLDVPTQ
jgi:hypothetical protein